MFFLYQAEEGMTWEEWVESDYNTSGYEMYDNPSTIVLELACVSYESTGYLSYFDLIKDNYDYFGDGSCINEK